MTKLPSSKIAGMAEEILSNLNSIQQKSAAAHKSIYGFKAKPTNGPFLTPRELAEVFSVSTKTLERWRKSGCGPAYVRICTKNIRYPIVGLEEWVRENLVEGEQP